MLRRRKHHDWLRRSATAVIGMFLLAAGRPGTAFSVTRQRLFGCGSLRPSLPHQPPIHVYRAGNQLYMSHGIDTVPKAAVSVAVRWRVEGTAYYLLVQRGKEPNKGMWSLPGGSIEFGEKTFDAAQRELAEEVVWQDKVAQSQLEWHPFTVTTTDSIASGYHYVICQYFAESFVSKLPLVDAEDDADDAAWFTLSEIENKCLEDKATAGCVLVLHRVEELCEAGMLPTGRVVESPSSVPS